MMHQFNMRMSVSALRDVAAERRAKERAEAPTVKTEEQVKADEIAKEKQKDKEKEAEKHASQSIWKRKFRPLPEPKAVDLFADVIGDTFILAVATALILYEYLRSKGKPDANAEKIAELEKVVKDEERRILELEESEKQQEMRVEVLEQALELLRNPPPKKSRLSLSA
jgi:hypothetical protein